MTVDERTVEATASGMHGRVRMSRAGAGMGARECAREREQTRGREASTHCTISAESVIITNKSQWMLDYTSTVVLERKTAGFSLENKRSRHFLANLLFRHILMWNVVSVLYSVDSAFTTLLFTLLSIVEKWRFLGSFRKLAFLSVSRFVRFSFVRISNLYAFHSNTLSAHGRKSSKHC